MSSLKHFAEIAVMLDNLPDNALDAVTSPDRGFKFMLTQLSSYQSLFPSVEPVARGLAACCLALESY